MATGAWPLCVPFAFKHHLWLPILSRIDFFLGGGLRVGVSFGVDFWRTWARRLLEFCGVLVRATLGT